MRGVYFTSVKQKKTKSLINLKLASSYERVLDITTTLYLFLFYACVFFFFLLQPSY